jgi:hypothetical protein
MRSGGMIVYVSLPVMSIFLTHRNNFSNIFNSPYSHSFEATHEVTLTGVFPNLEVQVVRIQ